jgi:phenylalanyl-tRNA synthetase alpha chain
MFTQVEGLVVDEGISLGDLKGTLHTFAQRFFRADVRTRFRPSFFPYTEPSAELDVECQGCTGAGCPLCKHTGWIEVLGCGMVHPAVFEAVGYDAERYTGFAFGVGIERLALRLFGIDDIRMFYENDLRFLSQVPL